MLFLRQPTILGGSVLAKQVYSFTKIQKKRTYKGIYGTVLGISSIVLVLGLMAAAFLAKGGLNTGICMLAYVSLAMGIAGFIMADGAKKDDDAFGRFIHSGIALSLAAMILHGVVFIIGCLAVIL